MRAALVAGSVGLAALIIAAQVALRWPSPVAYELTVWALMAGGLLTSARLGWTSRRAALLSLAAPLLLELMLTAAFSGVPAAYLSAPHAASRILGLALAASLVAFGVDAAPNP